MGAVDFLFKPIVPEILRSKVSVFVELSRNNALLRRQAEVLVKAEAKFRSLLEAAPDSMIISSEDGEINLINSQAESMFGYLREELIGRNVTMLVPGWTARKITPIEVEAHRQLRGFRKNGDEFPVEINLSPLATEESVLVTSAIRDVTE